MMSNKERDKNIEQNLDFIHKKHMEAVLYEYHGGNLERTHTLCMGAMSSQRLPAKYRAVYEELVKKIDAAPPAEASTPGRRANRDQAIVTEELALNMLHVLNVSKDEDDEANEKSARGFEDIAAKAKALEGTSEEDEKTALFHSLVKMARE